MLEFYVIFVRKIFFPICFFVGGGLIPLLHPVFYAYVKSHGLSPHKYADDTQVYGSYRPTSVDDFSSSIPLRASAMFPAG